MTATAIGAAAAAPKPPPFTMTPTAMVGLLAGAKHVNTASFSPVLFTPFCAVPVFPAISTPATPWLAVAKAVPSGLLVTASIIWVRELATVGGTGWLSGVGLAVSTGVAFGDSTCLTRYGVMS